MGAGATKQQVRPTEESAREHFNDIDTSKSNSLSIEELVAAAKRIAKVVKRKWTDEEITRTFHSLDLNNDGSLDFAEFCAGLDALIGRSSKGRRSTSQEAKSEIKAEQARMIEEVKRMFAAANASLEAVGHRSSTEMLWQEEQQPEPVDLERRMSEEINRKVSPFPPEPKWPVQTRHSSHWCRWAMTHDGMWRIYLEQHLHTAGM
jgi:Ca2+-binding EF-hand superfamily protein